MQGLLAFQVRGWWVIFFGGRRRIAVVVVVVYTAASAKDSLQKRLMFRIFVVFVLLDRRSPVGLTRRKRNSATWD